MPRKKSTMSKGVRKTKQGRAKSAAPSTSEWRPLFCYDGPEHVKESHTYYRTKAGVWMNISDVNVYCLLNLREALEDEFMIETRSYRAICAEIERRKSKGVAA